MPNREHVSSPHSAVDRESPGGFVHIPALDGIRGLAILLVLAYHLLWANLTTGSRLLDLFQQFREAAYCVVNLFFTLSGFLLTGILIYLPHSPTFSCADNLLFGCALSAMLRTAGRDTILRLAPRALALCSIALALTVVLHHGLDWTVGFFIPTFGFSLLGLTGAALIATTLKRESVAQRTFSLRFLRFFGKYSYGLSVFHYSIEGFLSGPLRATTFAHLHSKSLAVLLPAIVILALSVIAALISYHLFESQFLHLKRYFGYARAASPQAPVALAP